MVAANFGGWEAVRGPGPMTWQEYALSRQHLVEERLGTRAREAQRLEDDLFDQNRRALKGVK